jgi:hypothetical protein
MAELYSLKITGVYDDGTGRLVQGPLPWMLAAGCSLCGGICLEVPPCEFCSNSYCISCLPCRDPRTFAWRMWHITSRPPAQYSRPTSNA